MGGDKCVLVDGEATTHTVFALGSSGAQQDVPHCCAGAQLVQPRAHWVIVLGRRWNLCANYLCNWN